MEVSSCGGNSREWETALQEHEAQAIPGADKEKTL